jgi:hypothetical protein
MEGPPHEFVNLEFTRKSGFSENPIIKLYQLKALKSSVFYCIKIPIFYYYLVVSVSMFKFFFILVYFKNIKVYLFLLLSNKTSKK